MSVHPRIWSKWLARAGLVALVLAFTACSQDPTLSTLHPQGPNARAAHNLFMPVFWVATAVFVVVEGLLVIAVLKFRDRGGTGTPRQIHGNTRMEIAWTIAPALILAVIAVPTVATIFAMAQEPEDAVQVHVIGHQWWWEFRYDDEDVVTANELHIPAERPIQLRMEAFEEGGVSPDPTTPSDGVIHSFWVPRLAGKQDVVPGHTNHLVIEADEPGEYFGQCAEFCGLSHANMRVRVIAHTERDYQRWLEEQRRPAAQPTEALATEGQRVFSEGACVGCHAIEGISEAPGGPDLTHFASRQRFAGSIFETNEENLAAWLRDPPGQKPGSRMPNLNLSEQEVDALVAYLLSLT